MKLRQWQILSQRMKYLAPQVANEKFRERFLVSHMRMFLSNQIRALRGALSQAEYSIFIDKPQSVVSRLENPESIKSIQSLLDIAHAHEIALLVQFVDYTTYFQIINDYSDEALAPLPYNQEAINALTHDYVMPPADSSSISVVVTEDHCYAPRAVRQNPHYAQTTPPPLSGGYQLAPDAIAISQTYLM